MYRNKNSLKRLISTLMGIFLLTFHIVPAFATTKGLENNAPNKNDSVVPKDSMEENNLKEQLEKLIKKSEEVDFSKVTKKSADELKAAIGEAKKVLESEETQYSIYSSKIMELSYKFSEIRYLEDIVIDEDKETLSIRIGEIVSSEVYSMARGETLTALTEAIEKARDLLIMEELKYKELEEASIKIETSLENLETVKNINKTALISVIEKYKNINLEGKSRRSKEEFLSQLELSKKEVEDKLVSQSDVDQLTRLLEEKVNNLKNTTAQTDEFHNVPLINIINLAKKEKLNKYSTKTVNVLELSIKNAESLLKNKGSIIADIEYSEEEILNNISKLRLKTDNPVDEDFKTLNEKINEALILVETSEKTEFTSIIRNRINDSIKIANNVNSNLTSIENEFFILEELIREYKVFLKERRKNYSNNRSNSIGVDNDSRDNDNLEFNINMSNSLSIEGSNTSNTLNTSNTSNSSNAVNSSNTYFDEKGVIEVLGNSISTRFLKTLEKISVTNIYEESLNKLNHVFNVKTAMAEGGVINYILKNYMEREANYKNEKESLGELIISAEKLDLTLMSSDSVNRLRESINNAKKATSEDRYNIDTIREANEKLSNAIISLDKVEFNKENRNKGKLPFVPPGIYKYVYVLGLVLVLILGNKFIKKGAKNDIKSNEKTEVHDN